MPTPPPIKLPPLSAAEFASKLSALNGPDYQAASMEDQLTMLIRTMGSKPVCYPLHRDCPGVLIHA